MSSFQQQVPYGARAQLLPMPPQEVPGPRSFYRVGLILGLSGTAIVAYIGACYLYHAFFTRVLLPPLPLLPSGSQPFVAQRGSEHCSKTVTLEEDVEEESPSETQLSQISTEPTYTVVLHQCPRGYYTPCIAPFSLKLETFLRVTSIPYTVSFSSQPQDKQSPWLTVGGQDIVDSHDCINFLCNTFNVDLENGAKASRLTASRLVEIMLDNHVYWGIALWRWVYDKGNSLKEIQPLSPKATDVIPEVAESVKRAAWYHGLGRLSYDRVVSLIKKDMGDLAAALGKHDFFLGNRPGEVDCNAFGMLSQILWNMPGSPFEDDLKKYPNLVNFVLRVRHQYWPDWDELLQKPGASDLSEKLLYPTGEFEVSMAKFEVTKPKMKTMEVEKSEAPSDPSPPEPKIPPPEPWATELADSTRRPRSSSAPPARPNKLGTQTVSPTMSKVPPLAPRQAPPVPQPQRQAYVPPAQPVYANPTVVNQHERIAQQQQQASLYQNHLGQLGLLNNDQMSHVQALLADINSSVGGNVNSESMARFQQFPTNPQAQQNGPNPKMGQEQYIQAQQQAQYMSPGNFALGQPTQARPSAFYMVDSQNGQPFHGPYQQPMTSQPPAYYYGNNQQGAGYGPGNQPQAGHPQYLSQAGPAQYR